MIRALLVVASLVSLTSSAQTCPVRTVWPTPDWDDSQLATTLETKREAIAALEQAFFTLEGADADRNGLRTDAFLIIKGGRLIYERYGRGYSKTNRHISWSVAKSYSSVLTGIAVKQGAMSIDDSICKHLTEYEGKPVCSITAKHALTFSTGLAWQEGYENEPYRFSSVISMLFGEGHRDQLSHILTHRQAFEPGKEWEYSTGDAQLESAVVKRALEAKGLGKDAFWTLLFDKLGAPGTVFEEDVKGTPLGGSCIFSTPRNFARLGYLMLNDGCWAGERLLPEGWVAASTTPSEAYRTGAADDEKVPSGYSWWLNRPVQEKANQPKPWPDAPEDTFAARGHWGQNIIVVPSEDVVIARFGDDRKVANSTLTNNLVKFALQVAR